MDLNGEILGTALWGLGWFAAQQWVVWANNFQRWLRPLSSYKVPTQTQGMEQKHTKTHGMRRFIGNFHIISKKWILHVGMGCIWCQNLFEDIVMSSSMFPPRDGWRWMAPQLLCTAVTFRHSMVALAGHHSIGAGAFVKTWKIGMLDDVGMLVETEASYAWGLIWFMNGHPIGRAIWW